LCAYCHVDGKRVIAHNVPPMGKEHDPEVLLEVPQNIPYRATIEITETGYTFTARVSNQSRISEVNVEAKADKKLGRTIGPWFGGNNPAPVRVNVRLQRKYKQ